jgi:hypothetical protein
VKTSVLIATAASSLLVACTSIDVTDPTSRYYEIPVASIVVVEDAIPIPPDSAHVVLQDGKIVAPQKLRRYEPFCEIEVNDVLEAEQHVRPGRFAVTRVVRQQQLGAGHQPVLLAGITLAGSGGLRMDGALRTGIDDPFALNAVHLRLTSSEQPNVRELRCAAGWAFLSSAVYPTLAEMRGALGSFVRIEIKEITR